MNDGLCLTARSCHPLLLLVVPPNNSVVDGPGLVVRMLSAFPLALLPQPPVQLYAEQLRLPTVGRLLLRMMATSTVCCHQRIGRVLELLHSHDGCRPDLQLLLTARRQLLTCVNLAAATVSSCSATTTCTHPVSLLGGAATRASPTRPLNTLWLLHTPPATRRVTSHTTSMTTLMRAATQQPNQPPCAMSAAQYFKQRLHCAALSPPQQWCCSAS